MAATFQPETEARHRPAFDRIVGVISAASIYGSVIYLRGLVRTDYEIGSKMIRILSMQGACFVAGVWVSLVLASWGGGLRLRKGSAILLLVAIAGLVTQLCMSLKGS